MFTADPAVIAIATLLIPIAALFQIFDGVQAVASGALRGLGDTRVPAMIAVLCYWVVCIPLAYVLVYQLGIGPQGPWWGLAAGLGIAGVLLTWRLVHRMSGPIESLVQRG